MCVCDWCDERFEPDGRDHAPNYCSLECQTEHERDVLGGYLPALDAMDALRAALNDNHR